MQNFVGLQSTRGTGTSGHVQQSRVRRNVVLNERTTLAVPVNQQAQALIESSNHREEDKLANLERKWTLSTNRIREEVETEFADLKREYVRFAVERRNAKRLRQALRSDIADNPAFKRLLDQPRRRDEDFPSFVARVADSVRETGPPEPMAVVPVATLH